MDIILVPGLWLGGWAWSEVVPELARAGHRAVPLTLPGMHSIDADRSVIALADQVDAVIAAIDAAEGPVVLVGHSAGCGIVYAAADARVDRVARLVLVAGFPAQNGQPLLNGFTPVDGEIALPPWDEFDDADRIDLGEAGETTLRERAIPAPAAIATDIVHLSDERRLDIPVTAIATEYAADDLQEWIAAGEAPVQEFTRLHDVIYIDVPTGHWPMLTKPRELAAAILAQPPL